MKRLGMVALLFVALAAGFTGSYVQSRMDDAETVVAQKRSDQGIRVAVVNLEECARQSPRFQRLKDEWELRQQAVKENQEKMQQDYERILEEIRKARLEDQGKGVILNLRVELQSLEEAIKASREEDQNYLQALLNKYQKDVLKDVMEEVETYAKIQKFDMVIQDYTIDTGDAAFFEGSAFAQALLSKPMLYAPGIADNSNAYVTDITEAIIQRLDDKEG